jgi:hypothetical protein
VSRYGSLTLMGGRPAMGVVAAVRVLKGERRPQGRVAGHWSPWEDGMPTQMINRVRVRRDGVC